ncbi:hypothetical protein QR680_017902 [Steinernema hermaphroditum]|uniref:Uncharacterized protein n=1 Tax=Steinernema hermaphroditum TaxID=289476 RepID=A0AA39LPV7_9BILA|nr:hypothetical protein QR680_017902 [Steinernema hermaphroditum]
MTLHQELIHFLSSARSDPEMWKYVCADAGERKIKQFLLQEYPEANPNGIWTISSGKSKRTIFVVESSKGRKVKNTTLLNSVGHYPF